MLAAGIATVLVSSASVIGRYAASMRQRCHTDSSTVSLTPLAKRTIERWLDVLCKYRP